VDVVVSAPEGGLAKASRTRVDQLRSVDRSRLGRRLGRVAPETMAALDERLKTILDL